MTDVQLLLATDSNRQLLASFIEPWATPVVHDEVKEADLYLIDDTLFSEYRDAVEAQKQSQQPVFCPVVLLHRGDTPSVVDGVADINDLDDTITSPVVDETLRLPVQKQVLARRLVNLLHRRRQTEELQETNERLEQFASVVSHDLRNPLNVAEGRLELARMECESDQLDKAASAIDRGQALIDDLLTLAREGDDVDELMTIELPALLEDSWGNVETKQATLVIDIDHTIQANRLRLMQLFENLFRNAIEHGADDVTVTVGPLEDGLYVADDGPGIPDDVREKVFEFGYSSRTEGTGFGLNITQKIAEGHGWEIQATDSEDGGARFEITGVESNR